LEPFDSHSKIEFSLEKMGVQVESAAEIVKALELIKK
jgi:hypothetical protein